MAKPKTVDPRLELVNFEVLDMDKFPPVEEWTEDDYEEAGLLNPGRDGSGGVRA